LLLGFFFGLRKLFLSKNNGRPCGGQCNLRMNAVPDPQA